MARKPNTKTTVWVPVRLPESPDLGFVEFTIADESLIRLCPGWTWKDELFQPPTKKGKKNA